MGHAEVQAFFDAYREAFKRLDGDAVAELWHTPSGITMHRTLRRDDGTLLQALRTGYQLLRTLRGPKVLLVTQYEEDVARMNPHAAE